MTSRKSFLSSLLALVCAPFVRRAKADPSRFVSIGAHVSPMPEGALVNSMDGKRWAREFMDTYAQMCREGRDPFSCQADRNETEDWMHTWFANSIMAGYDEAHRRYDGKWKNMVDSMWTKSGPFILLCIALCSCTTLSDPHTGKRLLFTTANADLLEYSGGGVSLRVVNLRHESASAIIGAGGAAATAIGVGAATGL